MRTLPHSAMEAVRDEDGDLDATVRTLDWKAGAGDVLEAVDSLLAPLGLEVVQYDTQSDTYVFRIEKRQG